jgi:hypothetical protein
LTDTTPELGLRYPEPDRSEAPDIPLHFKNLADDTEEWLLHALAVPRRVAAASFALLASGAPAASRFLLPSQSSAVSGGFTTVQSGVTDLAGVAINGDALWKPRSRDFLVSGVLELKAVLTLKAWRMDGETDPAIASGEITCHLARLAGNSGGTAAQLLPTLTVPGITGLSRAVPVPSSPGNGGEKFEEDQVDLTSNPNPGFTDTEAYVLCLFTESGFAMAANGSSHIHLELTLHKEPA